ncbi:hypothetical protein CEXT_99111 [Caerostris extrusa]|uniref:Uncharacterized protein n=1 Tax=Caerostris extrusa TaxID=172846 RepID=A0AAV4NWV9_CAEEX|nr:hypothetical protein CEXT_99111 [Caerostris extrusa]
MKFGSLSSLMSSPKGCHSALTKCRCPKELNGATYCPLPSLQFFPIHFTRGFLPPPECAGHCSIAEQNEDRGDKIYRKSSLLLLFLSLWLSLWPEKTIRRSKKRSEEGLVDMK